MPKKKFPTLRRHHYRKQLTCLIAMLLPFILGHAMVERATNFRAGHEARDISSIMQYQVESIFDNGMRAFDSLEGVLSADTCADMKPYLGQFPDAHLFIRTSGVLRDGKLFCVDDQHVEQWGSLNTAVRNGTQMQFLLTTPLLPDRPSFMLSRLEHNGDGMLLLMEARHLLELMESVLSSGFLVDIEIDKVASLSNDYFQEIDPGSDSYRHFASSAKYPVSVTTRTMSSRMGHISRRLWLYTMPFVLILSLVMGYAAWRLVAERYSPVKEIIRGLRRHEFYNVYQPIIDMNSGRCIGVEVLVRWQHSVFGIINPDVFIPIIDKSKLSVLLTVEVLRRMREDLDQDWLPTAFYISVNIFPDDFADSSFVAAVQAACKDMAPHASHIALEITERQQLSESSTVQKNMAVLREAGVTFSIDDFGTGHSSLSYLETFSMDCVKIDRLFVSVIGTERHDAPILDAMIALASRLEVNLIAEGIENEEQAEYLRMHGVTYAQGYLYARPMQVDALIKWLA